MGYSPIAFASLAMPDIVAPGVPQLILARVASKEVEARVTLPTVDADGGTLTGMTELLIVLLPEETAGDNPFGTTAAGSLETFTAGKGGFSTTIFLTDTDAGKLKTTRFPGLTVGKVYWAAATVKDDSV
jgi:hypothetical protein